MINYELLDLVTLKILYDEYKITERNKREELKKITAELEIIESFIDHASKCIYRAEQFKIIENERKMD
jgi:hypothetical protein